ncbi:cytochrome-c peroxidase [Dyadobacter sp. LJ419]|uniref:Cytochrome-c peroxidase n=1 Tax=Dyadobacter chenwenxiniae TaxID=2906456 RepID=A0A9X1PPY9_9BACT|nr:cytochrome c peroxidase [Dyadobacter chenwenxiniae]MCF0064340.1 cytochrome-c peroxidase [Dyadobacter chenwenxiniae]
MKKAIWLFGMFCLLFQGTISCNKETATPEPKPPIDNNPPPLEWKKPAYFPDPVYDLSKNPLTAEGVELGRFLFYDGILSRTDNIGCGTCHQQQAAFTHHGHDLSHGVDDLLGTRNSPAVQNMAFSPSFFWDGGVHDMDLVPPVPIENEVEMGERVGTVIEKLRKTPVAGAAKQVDYPKMFKAAFGTDEINADRMMKALSQFMTTLVSATSRYDYFLQGDASALTDLEKQGLTVFKQKCASCHSSELFTDFSFRNNGLIPNKIKDQGRYAITLNEADRLKFKVPSLRNVGLTAPYMHDGRFTTLQQVLNHYANDQSGSKDSIFASPTLDPLLQVAGQKRGIKLSATEKQAIIAFLRTLNDEQFINDKRFSDPGIGTSL